MSAFEGPFGPAFAIVAMALATYLCRVAGVVIMSRVKLTPMVERGLAALPGSIVAATIVPIAIKAGPAGIAGVLAAVVVTRLTHSEIAALACGVALAAAMRALGIG
ncbi:AzlD family protein [Enterovirga rhinocerotis]|uniref:Putative membrane protein n=1 Tax=Enterovirga rhinocerotis TaxID=1339210 RepID=A0A4R7BM90_9HYPH|nr:AzlD domain-containing protein [Enterovirga rhinocerotis]TDR85385.1 putative membrane protein [Enterovirga rhinocerotis]